MRNKLNRHCRFPTAFFMNVHSCHLCMSYANTFLNDINVNGFGFSIKYPWHGGTISMVWVSLCFVCTTFHSISRTYNELVEFSLPSAVQLVVRLHVHLLLSSSSSSGFVWNSIAFCHPFAHLLSCSLHKIHTVVRIFLCVRTLARPTFAYSEK